MAATTTEPIDTKAKQIALDMAIRSSNVDQDTDETIVARAVAFYQFLTGASA